MAAFDEVLKLTGMIDKLKEAIEIYPPIDDEENIAVEMIEDLRDLCCAIVNGNVELDD